MLYSFFAALLLLLQHTSPILPDAKLTPVATRTVTLAEVCTPGSSKKARAVADSTKDSVYASYHILRHKKGEYEIDHLISLELGGSNSRKNLWPQSYITKPYNAHVKDKLENELHSEICTHKITMPQAQMEISHNWVKAYQTRFEKKSP